MEHSQEFLKLVEGVQANVREVSVDDTIDRVSKGAKLIDVREDNEWETAHAECSVHLGRGIIERDIVSAFPEKDTELILYCGGGFRSALAADNLQKMGYTNVWSMAGGWTAWNEARAQIAPESSKKPYSVIDWLPYIGGLFAGCGVSIIALGLFIVRNPSDGLLYVAIVLFAVAIMCGSVAFIFRNRANRPD